ncbi:cysteine protease atg4da isoform X2 [Bacillus rossius redtenbacheri]|uniref:cysteine protease atg4da isoform X2 n=1 Tax=Bacillus rossius redtenbacheri TaxID=93214 RepID=UPI002FDDC302
MNSDEFNKDFSHSSVGKVKPNGRQRKASSLQKEDNDNLEESKVKTKLLSMWNNVKYDWRWYEDHAIESIRSFKEDSMHRRIIKWFGDNPSVNSPFSIHTLVTLGESSGKHAGDWYGPGSVAQLIRKAVEQAARDSEELKEICVYVAQDCAVYIQDVLDQCMGSVKSANDGKSLWKALILLVPLRLGMEKLNYMYGPCLTSLLQLETCIGIIGGRPKHALYFIGFQDDKLIHLDPHYCQEVVDVWQPKFPLTSFHCRSPRKMNITRMDPSCCVGFYCRTQGDFRNFVQSAQPVLVPPTETANCPIFVFSDGRSRDTLAMKCVIPDFDNELRDDSCQSNNDLGTDDFEFL